jgi:hypothetical protein
MHQGCDGSFGGGAGVVDKLRAMGFSGMPLPIEMELICVGCGQKFTARTMESKCDSCDMVYGVTPCHAADIKSLKAAGVGY